MHKYFDIALQLIGGILKICVNVHFCRLKTTNTLVFKEVWDKYIVSHMLSDVEKVLPVGKTFICSGIVDHEKDAVVQALNAHHFTVTEVKEKNGWVAIVAIYNGCK